MTTKEYTVLCGHFFRYYKYNPKIDPWKYTYLVTGVAHGDGIPEIIYLPLYPVPEIPQKEPVFRRKVTEWFSPPDHLGSQERYALITDEQEIKDCLEQLRILYGRFGAYHEHIGVRVTQKDLSDLAEDEARKICELLDLEFQSFLPRDAADYLPGKQRIKILGEGGYSTTIEIHESGQVVVFYGAKQVLISEINALPITDYLRSRGYVFKY